MASELRRAVFTLFLVGSIALFLGSCKQNENSPGVEYMPDMYRTPAIEAYVDYQNPDSLVARKPAEGTIPFSEEYLGKGYNPNLPYRYPDNTEGYEKAGEELKNPLPLSKENIQKGEEIYTTFCDHCHGEEGKGNGPVIENGGHPPPPSFTGPLSDLPEGKAFHTITYGKGLMGSHAKQLDKKERWLVVQYVQKLQNGGTSPLKAKTDSSAAENAEEAGTDTTEIDTSSEE